MTGPSVVVGSVVVGGAAVVGAVVGCVVGWVVPDVVGSVEEVVDSVGFSVVPLVVSEVDSVGCVGILPVLT